MHWNLHYHLMNVSTELMYTLILCTTCTTIQADFAATALKAVEERKRYNVSWVPRTSNKIELFQESKIYIGRSICNNP